MTPPLRSRPAALAPMARRAAASALAAVGAAALGAVPRPAGAQAPSTCEQITGNLVRNCGFEENAYSNQYGGYRPVGYTVTAGNPIATGVFNFPPQAHSGASYLYFEYPAFMAPPGGPVATVSQTLATTAGASYAISFYARTEAGASPANNLLTVSFGGAALFSTTVIGTAYQRFTFTGVAAGAATDLAFTAFDTADYTLVDDLSVVALPAAGPVTTPEPSTWGLLGSGLLAVGAAARRRSRTG